MNRRKFKSKFYRIFRNPFLLGGIIGILSLHLVRELGDARRSAPPPLLKIGDWQLTDHNGDNFGSLQLNGKVVIANLFFTRCPSICPKLIHAMKEVSKRFDGFDKSVNFVSISIDPEYDKPKILRKYMLKNNISNKNWSFLTGDKQKVYSVVIEKMKLHAGDKKNEKINNKKYDIDHFGKIILLDQNGNLRGIFSTDNHILAALERAAKLLVEKGP